MDEQQKQTILDLPKVIAVGIASPVATILTSRFGVAGTLIGLALGAVILTALADFLKVYLARAPATVAKVPDTVVKMPGGLRTRLSWRNIRSRLRAAFARFSSLPPASVRRRSILIGSIVAAGISFLVGLSVVTALELGVGKSLSCWVWNECSTEASTDDRTSITSTLPSILGGGQSASSVAPKVQPPPPQQPTPGVPEGPSQPGDVPSSEQQPSSPQPGQRWSPSVVPEEDQQPSTSEGSEEDEQQSPASKLEQDQQQDDQREQPSSGSDQETREPATPSVPFST